MKFSQSDLTKLALGAGAGYLGASLLIPSHRGWADNCPWDCRHVPTCADAAACISKCGPGVVANCDKPLGAQRILHPGPKPKGSEPVGAYQPFTPEFITGQTPSTGPISSGICKMINLPGCDTVVDPNTGKSVKAGCPFMGMNFPVDCWVLAAAGALVLVLALK